MIHPWDLFEISACNLQKPQSEIKRKKAAKMKKAKQHKSTRIEKCKEMGEQGVLYSCVYADTGTPMEECMYVCI